MSTGRTNYLRVRLNDQEMEWLSQMAEFEHITISEFVRQLITTNAMKPRVRMVMAVSTNGGLS